MSSSSQGGQAQVDEFPPFQTVDKLENTPGVKMTLFPSTRTDYMMMNERYAPLADVHVRRAISLAIDREAIVKSVLFGARRSGELVHAAAGAVLRPELARASSTTWTRPSRRWPSPSTRTASTSRCCSGRARPTSTSSARSSSRSSSRWASRSPSSRSTPSIEFANEQEFKYQLGFSYWTMDIADPDELVTFAVDPDSGAKSFYTDYSNAGRHQVDAPGRARVRHRQAPGALHEHPEAGGRTTRSWRSSSTRRTGTRTPTS